MYYIMLALFTIFVDQLTKHVVEHFLVRGQSVPLVPDIIQLTLVYNPGAVFGIMPQGRWFFIVVTLFSLVVLGFFFKEISRERVAMRLGITLIMSGAVGNLIDRVLFGHVIDFVDFYFWPVFNIADIVLCLGAALFIGGIVSGSLQLKKLTRGQSKKKS